MPGEGSDTDEGFERQDIYERSDTRRYQLISTAVMPYDDQDSMMAKLARLIALPLDIIKYCMYNCQLSLNY